MSSKDDDFVERLTLGWVASSRDEMLNVLSQVLAAERAKSAQLEQALQQEKMRVSDLQAIVNDFAPMTDRKISSTYTSELELEEASDEEEMVGRYPPHVRKLKIEKYRNKRQRRLERVPVSRNFHGRSAAAQNRQRLNGKFVKYC